MPVQNPFSLCFSGLSYIISVASVTLGIPTTWGTAPSEQVVIGVNAELFCGNTAIQSIAYGSPAIESVPVYVVNPSSGSVSVTGIAQVSPTSSANTNTNPFYVNVVNATSSTVNQGSKGTAAQGWFVELTDGTNVIGVSAYPLYVQGTVTANQGSAPWSVTFPSAQPVTMTSTTITGTVAVTQSTSPWVVSNSGTFAVQAIDNLTQVASTTLGAPTAYGTPPSGNVIGVNSYVTSLPAVTIAASQTIAVTNVGTFAVQSNISQWGSAAVAPAATTSPMGSEAAPVVRNIQRKYQAVVTTAIPSLSSTYYYGSGGWSTNAATAGWWDTQQSGTNYITWFSYGSMSSGSWASVLNTLVFHQTGDPTNNNLTQTSTSGYSNLGAFYSQGWPVTDRYWRIVVTTPTSGTISTFEANVVEQTAGAATAVYTLGGQASNLMTTSLSAGDANTPGFSDTTWYLANSFAASNLGTTRNNAVPVSVQAAITTGNSSWSQTPVVALRTPNVFKTVAAVSITAGTPVAIWTPASGKKFRLMGWCLSLSVAGSVILKDNVTESIRTPLMAAGIGLVSPPMGNGILSAAANNALNADVTATASISGYVFGTEE